MALRFGSKKRAAAQSFQDCATTFASCGRTAVPRILEFYTGYCHHHSHVKTICSGNSAAATGPRGAGLNLVRSLSLMQLRRIILDERSSSLSFKFRTSPNFVVQYSTGSSSDVVAKKRRVPPHLYGAGWDRGWEEVCISVWWDFENCHIPVGIEVHKVGYNIVSGLRTSGFKGPVSIAAYGDILQITRSAQEALTSTGIRLCHVPCGGKDSTDRALLVDLILWTVEHPPPAHLFLISGDRDFSDMLHRLRMKNYNILLACPSGGVVSPALLGAATHVWRWNSLVRGEGLQGASSSFDPKPPPPPDMTTPPPPLQNNGTLRSSTPPPPVSPGPAASPAPPQECSPCATTHSKAAPEPDTAGSKAGPANRSVRGVPKYVLQKLERLFESHPNGILLHDLQNHLIKQGIKFQRDFYGHGQIVPFLLAIPEVVKVEGPVKDDKSWTYLLTPTQQTKSSRPDSETSAEKAAAEGGSSGSQPSSRPSAPPDDLSHENVVSAADRTPVAVKEGSGTTAPAAAAQQQPQSPPSSSSEIEMASLLSSLPISSSSSSSALESKEESGMSEHIHNVRPRDSESPQVHAQSLEVKKSSMPSSAASWEEEQAHPLEGLGSPPTPAALVEDVSQARKPPSFWASFIQAVQGWVRRNEVSVKQGQLSTRTSSRSDAMKTGTDAVVPEADMTTSRPPLQSLLASRSVSGNDTIGHDCMEKAGEAEEAKSTENDRQVLAGSGNDVQVEELRHKEKVSEESKDKVAVAAAGGLGEESKGPTTSEQQRGTDAKDDNTGVSVTKQEQREPSEVRKAYWKSLLFRMRRIQTTVPSSPNLPKTEREDLHDVSEGQLWKQTWNELLSSQPENAIIITPPTEESNMQLPLRSDAKRTWSDFFFGHKKGVIHSLPSMTNEPAVTKTTTTTTTRSAAEIEKRVVHQIERNDTNMSLDPPADALPSWFQQVNLANDFPTSSTKLTSISEVSVNETGMPESQISTVSKTDSQADQMKGGSLGSSSTVGQQPPPPMGAALDIELPTSPCALSSSVLIEPSYPSFQQFQLWLGGFLEHSFAHSLTVQRRGMDISDIKPAFEKEFGMKLDPRVYGFLKVKELVVAIPDVAEVVCPRYEQVFLFPAKSSSVVAGAFRDLMARIPPHRDLKNDCEQLLRKLLLENPQGIPASKLKPAFVNHYNYVLDHRSAGYARLSDLLRLMPDVVVIMQSASGVQFLAAADRLLADHHHSVQRARNTVSEELAEEGGEGSFDAPDDLPTPHVKKLVPEESESVLLETEVVAIPSEEIIDVERSSEETGVAEGFDKQDSSAESKMVLPGTPPEHSAELPAGAAAGEEARDEKQVEIDDSLTRSQSSGTGQQFDGARPNTGGVVAAAEKEETSVLNPSSDVSEIEGDTTPLMTSLQQPTESSDMSSSSSLEEEEEEERHSTAGEVTDAVDRDKGSVSVGSKLCCSGDDNDAHASLTMDDNTRAGHDDNSCINIDNRLKKNDVHGKDVGYDSSQEHHRPLPPLPESSTTTRKVRDTGESNFEFDGTSGNLEKILDMDTMSTATPTAGQEDQAQQEKKNQARDDVELPIAAHKPVRKSLWQRLFN